MRNLEAIEKDLAAAREALSQVEGTPAEVYSRIVGYYRSVRNWNKGKREEYGERRLYRVNSIAGGNAVDGESGFVGSGCAAVTAAAVAANGSAIGKTNGRADSSPSFLNPKFAVKEPGLLLFVRAACPRCQPAKSAAGRLGIPVKTINADTGEGAAEAARRGVFSTPTAILVSADGEEIGRALDAEAIGRLLEAEESGCIERVAV